MREERSCRRPGFRPGHTVRLADGQFWTFPAPVEEEGATPPALEGRYQALVRACLEAEDEPDRRRSELALAIALLDSNYLLESTDFSALLEFEPGSPTAESFRNALAGIVIEHVRALWKSAGTPEPSQSGPDWGLLVRPWKWLSVHSHSAHPSGRRRPTSTPRPLAQETHC